MQSFIMNSHEIFIHIHQGCFAGTGAIVRFPQCQWSKPDGYGIISQCITTTKHSKAKTVCIFLGIYCTWIYMAWISQFVRHTHILMLAAGPRSYCNRAENYYKIYSLFPIYCHVVFKAFLPNSINTTSAIVLTLCAIKLSEAIVSMNEYFTVLHWK